MKRTRHPFSRCLRYRGETPVQNGLAVTPAQVLSMAEQGLPISAQMQSAMIDGHTHSDWSVPLEEQRGVDIAQMWQASRSIRDKFVRAHGAGTIVTENA